jgi:penicillin G amidase
MRLFLFLFVIFINCPISLNAQKNAQLLRLLRGLQDTVNIQVDAWGVPHIYAQNENDLFFAQGYYACRDRLFQFELWRRKATGTMAEILGQREVKRDNGARLFKFRGDIKRELQHYHPRGEAIVNAFVKGINAAIEQANSSPETLPLEFKLLNITPQYWTPEVVISRHQGLLANVTDELRTARAVAILGENKVKEVSHFHPLQPNLTMKTPNDGLFEDILGLYNAFRKPVEFQPSDLGSAFQNDWKTFKNLVDNEPITNDLLSNPDHNIGSNNWVISGAKTQSGYPILANDPHRAIAVPSLRYMAHLHAPNWNVIGGGEPVIPGISIGHNTEGAWGLTIFDTDAEDLYVYDINPQNPLEYRFQNRWEKMTVIREAIPIKGKPADTVELKYTRHGPVVFEDAKRKKAYSVRCAWLEVGGAPYLASLRMNQSTNWLDFRAACAYSHIPSENMIWADRKGNIGWQAVGITPIRNGFSGLVPLSGDGSQEWSGYLPILSRPNSLNPATGFVATANNNLTPPQYPHIETTIGFEWSDSYRHDRISEVLGTSKKMTLSDMTALQTDYLSIPARQLVPLLKDLKLPFSGDKKALIEPLFNWNYVLDKNSIIATIYVEWEYQMERALIEKLVAEKGRAYIDGISTQKIVEWLTIPDGKFGDNPTAGRDSFLIQNLEIALANLEKRLGADVSKWQYGQEKNKHTLMKHPLSNAANSELKKRLEVGILPRGGYENTVASTGSALNQASGASFRIVMDLVNWDATLCTNTAGQSGNPEHPNYRNLFDLWAKDKYFPLFFSKEKIETVTKERLVLVPMK